MTTIHVYYHSKGVTDLDAIRKDAMYRLVDKRHPQESLIHLHPHGNLPLCQLSPQAAADASYDRIKDKDHEWVLFERIDVNPAYVNKDSKILTWNDKDHDK
jgi:hypothetical protein